MVPEATLRDGDNAVEVFEVLRAGACDLLGALLDALYISGGCVHGPCSRPRWPPWRRLLRWRREAAAAPGQAAGRGPGLRRVPARHAAAPRRQHRRRALPALRRPGRALHLVPQRVHDLRLDLQVGAGDHGRGDPAARHGGGLPQPSAQRLHAHGRARLRRGGRGVGGGALPAADLPGRAPAPPGVLKRLAGGGRPPRLHAWVGSIRERGAADLLPPPRAAAARALDLPPVRAPEQAEGQRPDPGDQRAEGASTTLR